MCRSIVLQYIGLHLSTTIKFYASINLLNSCSIKIQWKMHFNNMLLLDNEIQGLMKLYFLNMNIAWKKSFEGFFFVFSICFSFCGHSNEHECHKRLFEHWFLLIRKCLSATSLEKIQFIPQKYCVKFQMKIICQLARLCMLHLLDFHGLC